MIELGIDYTLKDKHGKTALQIAEEHGLEKVAVVIREIIAAKEAAVVPKEAITPGFSVTQAEVPGLMELATVATENADLNEQANKSPMPKSPTFFAS